MSSFKKHSKVLPQVKDIVNSTVDSSANCISITNNLTSAVSLLGVKPWINCGLGLVSTGNKQFDEFIGGGLSLGTLTLFDLDHISNYGDTLISYNIAESLSIGHETLLICFYKSSFEKYKKILPYNQHFKSTTITSSSTNIIANNTIPKEFQRTNGNDVDATTIEEDGAMEDSLTNKVSDSLKLAALCKKYIDEKEQKAKQSQSVIVPSPATTNSYNSAERILQASSTSSSGAKASVTYYGSSYDLSRSLQPEILENNPLHSFIGESLHNSNNSNSNSNNSGSSNISNQSDVSGGASNTKTNSENSINTNHNDNHSLSLSQVLDAYLQTIQSFIKRTIHERKTVGRIFIPDLTDLLTTLLNPVVHSCGYNSGFNNNNSKFNNNHNNHSSTNNSINSSSNNNSNTNQQSNNTSLLLKFLVQIKQMIRNNRIAVIFSIYPKSLSSSSTSSSLSASQLHQQISHVSDNYFSLDSFIIHHTTTASGSDVVPYEFREFQGFFCIHKLSCLGTLSAYRPTGSNYRYGLKRDRRKLNIEPLHLPPEDNRATASSVASDVKQMNQLHAQQSQVQQPSQVALQHGQQHQSHNHDHSHSNSHSYNQQTQNKTSGILAYEDDESTVPSSNYSSNNTNDTTTTNTTANTATPTTTASADQATRVSLLAAKFAKSATNVTKGSSISISKVNLTSNNPTTTESASNNTSHSKGNNSRHLLCSPSSGLLSNDAEKSLDF